MLTGEKQSRQGQRQAKLGRKPSHFSLASQRVALLGVLVVGLVVWEVGAVVGFLDERFVSKPTSVLAVAPTLIVDPAVRSALADTGVAMLAAIALAIVVGLFIGYAMGFSRLLRDAFEPPLLFLLSVPKSIFLPIFLVFLGIGVRTAIVYGAFSGVIYVAMNITGSFDLIQDKHLQIAKAFGASKTARLLHVVLPATIPGVFTGIWYGIKNGFNGVLIFEMFVSVGGLGALIRTYSNFLQTDRVLFIILTIAITAILGGSLWTVVERRLTRWRPKLAAAA